jgi:biopolymer transport protein ExbD
LLTHAVKIDLPKASSAVNITKPEHIEFGIRENGDLFFNGEALTMAELPARFAAEAAKQPQPEVHIRADRHAYYESIAKVMAVAAKTGLVRIGFVSEPEYTATP